MDVTKMTPAEQDEWVKRELARRMQEQKDIRAENEIASRTTGYVKNGHGSYDRVTNIALYMKRKRTVQSCVLDDSLLPMRCANPNCKFGGMITVENGGEHGTVRIESPEGSGRWIEKYGNTNRTEIYPKNWRNSGQDVQVQAQHYICSWENLLNYVYGEFYDKVMGY